MREYLAAMEMATFVGPEPAQPVPVILAALGPKMLELAATKTGGAHPYFVPVAHTEFARDLVGPSVFLAPEQAVVVESDPEVARDLARSHMAPYLGLDNYRRNLMRLGWTESELDDGGSDAVVDAVVAWGTPEAIAERIASHHDAGADHVSIQVIAGDPSVVPLAELEALAEYLL